MFAEGGGLRSVTETFMFLQVESVFETIVEEKEEESTLTSKHEQASPS